MGYTKVQYITAFGTVDSLENLSINNNTFNVKEHLYEVIMFLV